ncbi:unnamed protein product, partial [Polarella glacialis]
ALDMLTSQQSCWAGEEKAALVASGKAWAAKRVRGLYVDALCGLAECDLKGDKKDAQKALERCEEALQQELFSPEALCLKGMALARLGCFAEAQAVLSQGFSLASQCCARSAADAHAVLEEVAPLADEERLLKKVQKLREDGSCHVREGRYGDAAWSYEDGLRALWGKDELSSDELEVRARRKAEGLWPQLRAAEAAILTNLSLCCLHGQSPEWPPTPARAVELCWLALAYDPEQVEALVRLSHGFRQLQRYEDAEAVLTKAAKLRPNDGAIRQELERVRCRVDEVANVVGPPPETSHT